MVGVGSTQALHIYPAWGNIMTLFYELELQMTATAMNTGAPTYILTNNVMTTRASMHVTIRNHIHTPPSLVYTMQ